MPHPPRRPVPLEPLEALPDATLRSLRDRIAAAGYNAGLVVEAERVAPRQLDAVRLPLVHAWLDRRGGAGSTLAALFSYAGEVAAASAREALGAELVAALVGAGVLEAADGERIVSRYRLTPLPGLLFFSDPPDAGTDAVMGPGPTTMLLVDLVPERPGTVLDVGCGAGTLALVAAARGARRAVGVDLSERAVRLSRVNACMNGLPAEFRSGDLLDPVRGETFDLVLSQPPYVILPPGMASTTYLHGGPLGEELAVRFAAAFPAVLAAGGVALLHFDAPTLPRAPVASRLRAALGAAAVDLAVLTAGGPSADLEAAAFGALEDPGLGDGYRAAARRYRDHLAASGVEGFTRVLAVLRRGRGTAGFTAQSPGAIERMDAEDLARFLDGLDLAGSPDEALLQACVRAGPGARIALEVDPSNPERVGRTLRFRRGVGVDQELTDAGQLLVESLAASGNVSEAVDRYAEACGRPRQDVRAQVLAAIRDGLSRGAYARSRPRPGTDGE